MKNEPLETTSLEIIRREGEFDATKIVWDEECYEFTNFQLSTTSSSNTL